MTRFWKKITRVGTEHFPVWLEDDDLCLYARDYTSGGGYAASEANNLILNLKKPVSYKETTAWRYKEKAIYQFAQEVAPLFSDKMIVTCIPSSKSQDDPEYDSRLEDMLAHVQRLNPSVVIEYPIRTKETTVPAHGGGSRIPNEIYHNLEWVGLEDTERTTLVLLDDVLTSGAHFKACQRLIQENEPEIRIIGVFWARTVWPT